MRRLSAAYGVSLVALCVCDFLWLGVIAAGFYQAELGPMLLARPYLLPAALFYLLYPVGIVAFCVRPALAGGTWRGALISGALFGLVAYGTYDLSNLATLKGWSTTVAVVDMLWGMAVSAIGATLGFLAAARMR